MPETLTTETLVKESFAQFPSAITVLGARTCGVDQALVVATATAGVSLNPPLMTVALQRSSRSWAVMRTADRIGVSLLSEAQAGLVPAMSATDPARRWDTLTPLRRPGGALLVPGALAHLEASVFAVHEAGDHEIAVLLLHDQVVDTTKRPLIYHRSDLHHLGRPAF